MTISHTKNTLKKLEILAKELGYKVRYEKGNFQSGYCLVEHQRVAIVNKFFDKKNKSAGIRARKSAQELKTVLQTLRKEILEESKK